MKTLLSADVRPLGRVAVQKTRETGEDVTERLWTSQAGRFSQGRDAPEWRGLGRKEDMPGADDILDKDVSGLHLSGDWKERSQGEALCDQSPDLCDSRE